MNETEGWKILREEEVDGVLCEIYYDGPLITKQEAIAKGETRYFNMIPCKYGHISQRGVSNSACKFCQSSHFRKLKKAAKAVAAPLRPKAEIDAQKPGAVEGEVDQEAPPPAEATAPPAEAAPPEDDKRTAPDAFVQKDYTNSNIVRAICMRRTKSYTVIQMHKLAEDVKQQPVPLQTVRQILSRYEKRGFIERAGKAGLAIVYRTKPELLWHYDDRGLRDECASYDPEHKDRILLRFEEAARMKGKDEDDLRAAQAEDDLLSDLAEETVVMEAAPTALIGRAIVDYILKLRSVDEYDDLKARIDELRRVGQSYRSRHDDAIARLKRSQVELNELQRQNHDLRVTNSKLRNDVEHLKALVQRTTKGTFTMGEIASIKGKLEGLFSEQPPPNEGGNAQ